MVNADKAYNQLIIESGPQLAGVCCTQYCNCVPSISKIFIIDSLWSHQGFGRFGCITFLISRVFFSEISSVVFTILKDSFLMIVKEGFLGIFISA